MGKCKSIWLLAVVLATSGPAASVASPATPAIIAEVQTALDRGDAKAAANLADGGLKEPDNSAIERARLLLYRGLAEELLGAPAFAMRDLTAALAGNALPAEERAQALLQRGFLQDGQGQLAEAAADYSEVIALDVEGVANALNNRANVYRRMKRFDEARRDYRAALTARGKAQYAWYGLGQMAEAEGDTLSARGFYAKAVAADSAYVPALQRLSALGGPPEGAIADARPPIVLKPPQAAAAPPPGPVLATAPAASADALPPPPKPVEQALLPPATQAQSGSSAPAITLRPSMDQSAGARGQVQLGAWRSEAEARTGWEKAQARAPILLAGLRPQVAAADLPGRGRYYRLRIGLPPGTSGTPFCEKLTAQGLACLLVRD